MSSDLRPHADPLHGRFLWLFRQPAPSGLRGQICAVAGPGRSDHRDDADARLYRPAGRWLFCRPLSVADLHPWWAASFDHLHRAGRMGALLLGSSALYRDRIDRVLDVPSLHGGDDRNLRRSPLRPLHVDFQHGRDLRLRRRTALHRLARQRLGSGGDPLDGDSGARRDGPAVQDHAPAARGGAPGAGIFRRGPGGVRRGVETGSVDLGGHGSAHLRGPVLPDLRSPFSTPGRATPSFPSVWSFPSSRWRGP